MKKAIVLIGFLALTVVAYQNCSTPGTEDGSQFGSLNGDTTVDAKILNAPFPFDASINFLTYLSCPMVTSSNSRESIFTFRLGAYEIGTFNITPKTGIAPNGISTAGLKYRSEFLNYMDTNFIHSGPNVSADQIQTVLNLHPVYKQTQIQAVMRSSAQLSSPLSTSSTSNTPVFQNSMDLLSKPEYAKTLADNRNALKSSFPSPYPARRNLEMSLYNGAGNEYSIPAYQSSMSRAYIHVGFSDQNGIGSGTATINSIGPTGKVESYYGRGYMPVFDYPNGIPPQYASPPAIPNPPLGLNPNGGVREFDLSTSSPTQVSGANWKCFSYAIIRPGDAPGRCPAEPFNLIKRDELDIVRKTLSATDWDVNTTLKCVVPKASVGTCYRTIAENHASEPKVPVLPQGLIVPYGGFNGDYRYEDSAFTTSGIEYRYFTKPCTEGGKRECVNFASFCFKQP